jgi:hypothetical protein
MQGATWLCTRLSAWVTPGGELPGLLCWQEPGEMVVVFVLPDRFLLTTDTEFR